MHNSCCPFTSPILDEVLPPVLILEFIFGLLGNGLALWMFVFHMDTWKPNSIYLAHLAVADTILLFCLPFRAHYYLRRKDWIYGDVLCRILMFLLATNRAAGIFFLTAVAVDRYFKVVHPLNRFSRMSLGYATLVCCCLWVVIVSLTSNILFSSHLYVLDNRMQCESFNICMDYTAASAWHDTLYLLQFSVPTAIIVSCTVCITLQLKNRTVDTDGRITRAVYFVLTVALVFIVCFLPSTLSRMAIWILRAWYNECSHFKQVNFAFYTTVCLTYFNSVLNPVVYYFSSPALSGTIQRVWHKLLCRPLQEEEEERNPPPTTTRPFSVSGQL
ncbi:hydroxycarboxylic acid receptor 3-like [Alosa alosa]|uniref:hydroxycarboxylic acid receptor 3-like n=1 Tax=Alosa alosa TaxID=278164 RepID=UPI00201529B1|nr:hydroxycarboxylic acid receptor 3-like [Alosa alosa]